MIYAYGVSRPGTYHIKNNIVCQDSHKIVRCEKNMAIAAVADGLGSMDYSDVGSKIAVTTAVEYCQNNIKATSASAQILDTIQAAFSFSLKAIEKEAAENERDMAWYDTTLTLAVLIRDVLYYGHSGDSGIVALTTEGRYESVTEQQRDVDGYVFPLIFTDKWIFAQYSKKVSSVFLATDGILETLFPLYIKNAPVNIHVSLAQFFMDNQNLRIDKLGQEAVQNDISNFFDNIPDEQVNDDKTVVVLVNTSVKTKKQPKEYYVEPDWVELKKQYEEAWRRQAYPGLYKDAKTQSQPDSTVRQTSVSQQNNKPPKISPSGRESSARLRFRNSKGLFLIIVIMFVFGLSATGILLPIALRQASKSDDAQMSTDLPTSDVASSSILTPNEPTDEVVDSALANTISNGVGETEPATVSTVDDENLSESVQPATPTDFNSSDGTNLDANNTENAEAISIISSNPE